ncbi:N-acetylneuraminate synthase family protein [Candidatus Uhrbacteria bacterium]|nr:N-acetylneuraminate synthase family protein [Candidatus Uhrbacteria bacterium]
MLIINNRKVGKGYPTYIIAEIGVNHNGDVDLALKMVEAAKQAGADAVKVQIIDPDKSYAKGTESYEIFKKVYISLDDWRRVCAKAKELEIDIFATFTDPNDMALVNELGFPVIKISSSNVTNFPLLKAAAKTGKPIIMSTGLSYLSEVDEAARYLEDHGCTQMAILHCTSLYPTPPEEVNLRAITTLTQAFPYPIGFSEHTVGIHCSVAAVALGARIIEKHFTLDQKMEGPDHYFSSTPEEFKALVHAVREVERALGTGIKKPAEKELPERLKLQRVLVAGEPIKEGEFLTAENVTAKRSSRQGLSPKWYDTILGRASRRALGKDDPVTLDEIL